MYRGPAEHLCRNDDRNNRKFRVGDDDDVTIVV